MTLTNGSRMCCLALFVALLGTGCSGPAPDNEEQRESNTAEHDDHGSDHREETGHDDHGEEGIVELSPDAIERIGLRVVPVALHPFSGRRTTTGTLGFDEARLAHVAPRVDGRLIRVPGVLGATVAAGEELAVLDSNQLGEARAAYLRARAHYEVAQRRFEREQSLHIDRIISEQQVLEAEAEAREAAANLAATKETLLLLGLSRQTIESQSWNDPKASVISVRAPFAGRIVTREATLGELVSPQHILFTIADLSSVWLWVDLYERDLAHIETGGRAEVFFDAWPGETFMGRLAYVADQLDPATRTVRARVDLPNPERRLKPGMFARVTLASAEEPVPVLALPRTAVQRDDDESIVFVRAAPGRFERREVKIGRVSDHYVEVFEGVEEGEEVVTDGAFLLRSQASAGDLGGHHH